MATISEWRTETEFLVRSIRGIVWEADPRTIQFTYVSEDAERILGYSPEEWLQDGFWVNHIHPEDREWVIEECADATASGKHHEFEYRMIAADGRAVRLRDTVFVDMQHGVPTRLRGILVDISATEKSEQLLELLDEGAKGAVFRFSTNPLRCEYMGPAVTDITGYTPEEYYADPLLPRRIIHPEDKHRLYKLATTKASGEPVVLRMIRKDGRVVWTERRDVAVYDDLGSVVAIEGIVRDISERISLEARLNQAEKMESFSRLAIGAAHDVTNMLTVILGHCAIVLQQVRPDDPLKHRFEGIMEAGKKAALFAREILAFGKGKLPAARVVELSTVVASMKGLLSRIVGPQIPLIFDLDPEAGSIKTHLGQIEQVVLNLVINAHDAILDRGTITVATFPADPYIALVVSDTGSGIDPQNVPHIFEPYFTTKEHGTGLGLATVYEIVKRSGGDISVQSQPGSGTTFQLLFRRANL